MLICAVTQSCLALCDTVDCSPPGSSAQGIPGKNTGMWCHFLFQGIFPYLELNPRGIEPTSLVSPALAGGRFTTSATWEAHVVCLIYVGSEV